MRHHKIRRGVNWQWALKGKEVKQTSVKQGLGLWTSQAGCFERGPSGFITARQILLGERRLLMNNSGAWFSKKNNTLNAKSRNLTSSAPHYLAL